MKHFALIAFISAIASAQPTPRSYARIDTSRISVEATLRAVPPSSTLLQRFSAYTRPGPSFAAGSSFYTRILVDSARREYSGYELLLERPQPDACLATVGKLGLSPLNLAMILRRPQQSLNLDWTLLPPPALSEPRVLHDGDILSIEVFKEPVTGDKLFDDLRVTFFTPPPPRAPVERPIPTVAGIARDYSASDAELQLAEPRVFLNGERQAPAGTAMHSVRGPLVWLYLPEHGRYILSLTARPGLDFKKAGEVRGGAVSFTLDGDAIKLESSMPMATGDSAYVLYVLRDRDWEPTSERQKDEPLIGTVSLRELAALKR